MTFDTVPSMYFQSTFAILASLAITILEPMSDLITLADIRAARTAPA